MNDQQYDREYIIAELDRAAKTSGTAPVNRFNAVLTPAAVRVFEEKFQVRLPHEYSDFLTTVGNGGPGPHGELWPLERSYSEQEESWQPGFLSRPFPYTESITDDELPDDYDEDEQVVGTMIISDMGCGVFARLVVSGEASGEVWIDSLTVDGTLSRDATFRQWYLDWLARQSQSR